MTIDEAFKTTLSRIELNAARVELASGRYAAVKGALEEAIPGSRVRQIGSFQRRTKIRPRDLGDELDIDVVATVGTATRMASPGENGLTPQGALERVKSALIGNLTYKSMSPRVDAPVVSITYADKLMIEVVPAFVNKMVKARAAPQDAECYLIGTSAGQWKPADYDYDAQYITAANAVAASYLVPASKLVKMFVRNQGLDIKSFYIEVLCSLIVPKLVSEWQAKRYKWSHHHVFAHTLSRMARQLGPPVVIPGSYSLPVSSGLDSRREGRAKDLLIDKARIALSLTDRSGDARIVEAWRALFGDPFPTQ